MFRHILVSMVCLLAPVAGMAQDAAADQRQLVFDNVFLNAMQAKLKGDYQGAFDMLAFLNKQRPGSPAVLNELAKLLNLGQDYEAAADFAQQAVDADTTANESYINTAIAAYVKSGHQEKVLPLYDKLLAIDPEDVDVQYQRYTLLATMERYDEALALADKIKTKDPAVIYEIEIRKVAIFADQKKFRKAFRLANELDRRDPGNARTLYVLSQLYMMKGDTDEALRLCERATQSRGGSAFLFSLAEMYRAEKMDSLYASASLLAFASDDITEEDKLKRVYALFNRPDGMVRDKNWLPFFENVFCVLSNEYPGSPDVAATRESFYKTNGRLEQGYRVLTDFVVENQGTEYIWSNILSYAQGVEGMTNKQMVDFCRRAKEDVPSNPFFAIVLGQYQGLDGDNAGALASFNEAYAAYDNLPPNRRDEVKQFRIAALNGIASSYMSLDSVSKAFLVFDQILLESPTDALALNNYAYFLAKRGMRLTQAEQMSMKSLVNEPLNPTYLDTYAYVLLRQGKFNEALFVMERCMENFSGGQYGDGTGAEILEHYGDILFNLGRKEEALEQWRKASALAPENALIKRKIDEEKYIVE